MSTDPSAFEEAVFGMKIKDLGLSIAGTALAPVIAAFRREMASAGVGALDPRFYLSHEWGVPMGTVAIAIPFYLARPDLAEIQLRHSGFIEGLEPARTYRYLRHEMGHVFNYAHELFRRADWRETFGAFEDPYIDDYRPIPFDRRYVRHLPGWYAQKHPDEDFAETFAVWMTPGGEWRSDYRAWPVALAKLEYCDRIVREMASSVPLVTAVECDEDAAELEWTVGDFYKSSETSEPALPDGLDSMLRESVADCADDDAIDSTSVDSLIERLRFDLCAGVFQWTGFAPDRVDRLLSRLREAARALDLKYRTEREPTVVSALTAMITAIAMKFVMGGTHF